MIAVERCETAVAASETDALFEMLDVEPGVWMGCDVEAPDQFRRGSIACAVPALRFCLDGARLLVTPTSAEGRALMASLKTLAAFVECEGSLEAVMPTGISVVTLLRSFLAAFRPASRELAFYGAFSFDYYRLNLAQALPDDGRRRMVLYLPQRVLEATDAGLRRIDFRFGGEDPASGAAVPIPPAGVGPATDELPPGGHASRVAKGVDLLRRGELYSLVLSQAFRRRTQMRPSRAFRTLRGRNPYPGMFFCNLGGGEVLFGASPDQQVRADLESVESSPVCGTVQRGKDPLDDAAQTWALLASGKESAALALCADSVADELAAVCEPGSVEILTRRRVHFFSTIIHTIDHLRGRRRQGLDGFDILLAHATPATVTGLPKGVAIKVIEELEPEWRGWYAGAVARIGSDGSVEAYTILRAARIADGVAEIRTGGNILVDSDPEKEEDESRLKAQTLFGVLEDRPPSQADSFTAGSWGVRSVLGDDPYRHRLLNALAKAGGRLQPQGGPSVLSGAPRAGEDPQSPLLAVGEGAAWLLRRDGARMKTFATPEFARVVAGTGLPEGFLAGLPAIEVGWYMREGVMSGSLPADWIETAVSDAGWVLAAQHRRQRLCAMLFRPDSVLSSRNDAGTKALRAALEWLAPHGMFVEEKSREDT